MAQLKKLQHSLPPREAKPTRRNPLSEEIAGQGVLSSGSGSGTLIAHSNHLVSFVIRDPRKTVCQDHALVMKAPDGRLVMGVFDGLGGRPNGEDASRIAALAVFETVLASGSVMAGLTLAHSRLLELSRSRISLSGGPATTACVVEIAPGGALTIYASGDSPAFILRKKGFLEQASYPDNAFLRSYQDFGRIGALYFDPELLRPEWYGDLTALKKRADGGDRAAQDALENYLSQRHLLINFLDGGKLHPPMIIQSANRLGRGDRLLLLTDGISDVLTPTAIVALASRNRTATHLANAIIEECEARQNKILSIRDWGRGVMETFAGKTDDCTAIIHTYGR